jgi:hypothetical protein
MLSAIHINDERHYFMDKFVCSVSNKTCMMDRCSSCPEEAALQEYLIELTTEEDDGISKKNEPRQREPN